MQKLNIVSRLSDKNSQVDRMWERLTEIALFSRSKQHRAPASILKAFINPGKELNNRLREHELTQLRLAFGFVSETYRRIPNLAETKFATDQPQFYTLITTLLSTDLMDRYDRKELGNRIFMVAKIIDGTLSPPKKLKKSIAEYRVAAAKQTTNPNRREMRQDVLVKAIDQVEL
jgi:hypothetical protein